jgi:hypothetical protein
MKRTIVIAATALLVSSPAWAAKGGTTRITGCVQAVPSMCKGISSGGALYIVNTASPPIPLGTNATVTGTVTDKWAPCFGKWVEVTSWKANPKNGICR